MHQEASRLLVPVLEEAAPHRLGAAGLLKQRLPQRMMAGNQILVTPM